MKRIFIITNWEQLEADVLPSPLVSSWSTGETKGIHKLGDSDPILYFNPNGQYFQSQSFKDAEIILVFDKKYEEHGLHINENDFLLHHSVPAGISYKEFRVDHIKPGEHTLHNEVYTGVFNIIFDESIPNKVDPILTVLGLTRKQISDSEKVEELTEAIFTAIYNNGSEAQIEEAVLRRNNYLLTK
jgi:hypothetical protein